MNYAICFFEMSVLFETGELSTCVHGDKWWGSTDGKTFRTEGKRGEERRSIKSIPLHFRLYLLGFSMAPPVWVSKMVLRSIIYGGP